MKITEPRKLEPSRAKPKKLDAPVTLFAAIEAEQHDFLRRVAFEERRSLAEVVREALADFRTKKERQGKDSVRA